MSQTTKQLTPKLRFPEFSGEWEMKKLVDVSKNIAYGMNAAATTFDGVNKYLRITDIDEDSRSFIPKPLSSPEGKIEEKFILKNDDIVFARTGASVGKSYLYNEKDGKLLYAGFLIKFNIYEAIPYFVYLQTFRESYRKWVQVYSMRSGQPGLNAEEYKLLKINFPKKEEQQKISTFLTAVDSKITQLTKKKALLEQYKKVIMQKIFNQELRFKDDDGNAFSDWESKKLGEITKYYDGTHQTPNYVSEGVPFYSVEHVTANQFEKTKFISEEVFEKENKRVKLEKGDILMTRIGNVGKAKYIDWEVRASFYVSLALIKQNPSFSSKYLSQYLNAEPFQHELWKRIIHVAFPQKINLGEIGKCLVALPCIEEQTKIANFLSAIDAKINHVTNQLEQTHTFKKGLLQQLFV